MSRNTVEIILMCVVLVVLMIGMFLVIKTKYMPEVDDVEDYSYEENLNNVVNEETPENMEESQEVADVENDTEVTDVSDETNVEESEQ